MVSASEGRVAWPITVHWREPESSSSAGSARATAALPAPPWAQPTQLTNARTASCCTCAGRSLQRDC